MKKPAFSLLFILLSLAACTPQTTQPPLPSPTATQVSATEDVNSPSPSPKATPAAAAPQPAQQTKKGTYNGRIDNNSIELTLENGEYIAAQIGEALKQTFDSLKIAEEDKVVFTYTLSNGQYTIQSIQKQGE